VVDVKTLRITRTLEGRGRNKRTVHLFSAVSPSGMERSFDLRASVVPDAFVEAVVLAGIEVRREIID
jgi:hypothetical protein